MKRITSTALIIVNTILLSSSAKGEPHKTNVNDRPNVLFILVDQFRQDIAGTYGGKMISTPNIDRLANSGVVFSNAVSTCPVCTPYRGMLLTSQYPTHTGILVNFVNVNSNDYKNTLGELFANSGYKTGYIGKWHLGAGGWTNNNNESNGKAGIDLGNNYIPPGPGRLGFDYWAAYNFHAQFNNYYYYTNSADKVQTDQYETDIQVTQTIDFMSKQKDEKKPFFVVLSTHPPHPPFSKKTSPAEYLKKVPKEISWSPNVPGNSPRTVEEMRYYLAMAKNIDDNVGRLLDFLKKSGLEKNTIVVFTSDHGEMNGSHGFINKQRPYSEAIKIPLIYKFPGKIPQNLRKEVPFTPMDHLPTLCELAGIKMPFGKDGVSLAAILKSRKTDKDRKVLIGNYVSGFNTFSSGNPFPEWRGVFDSRYTYVKWLSGKEEFYDNFIDPFQMDNLIERKAETVRIAEYRTALEKLLGEADDHFLPGTEYAKWFDGNRFPKMNLIPGRN